MVHEPQPDYQFDELVTECGLSNAGAAYLFDVRVDTIRKWRLGKTTVPANVLDQMRRIHEAIVYILDA